METTREILWISSQDWDDLWTRKQRFAQAFARSGYRVFFVNYQLNLVSYALGWRKWGAHRFVGFARSPSEVEPRLYVWNPPLMLPYSLKYDAVNRINTRLMLAPLRHHLKRLGFRSPVLWIYPLTSAGLIGQLGERLVVYDCVDDWPSFKGPISRDFMTRSETVILQKADVCFVTHPKLLESRRERCPNIHLVPNGVEAEHFAVAQQDTLLIPEDVAKIPTPRIGFVGAFHFCLDYRLLALLAETHPEWSFVFVGPVVNLRRPEIEQLRQFSNVHLLGRRDYLALPAYLKAFDVCINPFDVNEEATQAIDPLKLYEYLAAGKPVVSVDMPAARQMSDYIRIAHSVEEFATLIAEAIAEEGNPRVVQSRMQYARLHSWEYRFQVVRQEVERQLARVDANSL